MSGSGRKYDLRLFKTVISGVFIITVALVCSYQALYLGFIKLKCLGIQLYCKINKGTIDFA